MNLADTIQVRGTPLVLNGMGLRTKYMVNAGLYLEQKSAAPTLGSNPTQQKRIVMQFLHGASKSQMADAFYASFTYTPPVARDAMKADVDRFAWSVGVKTGDQMVSMIFQARARSSFSMAAKADHPRPFVQMLFSYGLDRSRPIWN